MFTLVAVIIFFLIGLALAIFGGGDEGYPPKALGLGLMALAVIGMFLSMITRVPDGHVSAVSTFGVYSDTTLQPGLNLIAPWQSTRKIDARLQCRKFSAVADDEDAPFSNAVTAQAEGGGNLTIDMSVCTRVDPDQAVQLLKQVGPDYNTVLLTTAPRSCLRNSASEFTVDENIGPKRVELGERTRLCTDAFTSPRGLNVIEVLISDVDPGTLVRQSIDAKEQAEKDLQLAATRLAQSRIDAQREAAIALGVSNAEQIVACGGVERLDDEGEVISILPNADCEDQFSAEYLQWLYINQLSEVNGVVILPPEFDGQLFVQTPSQP